MEYNFCYIPKFTDYCQVLFRRNLLLIISQYFTEFILYSFIGWVWECTYCSFRTNRWQNRGFLYGPVCPIYGSGAVLCIIVFSHLNRIFDSSSPLWLIFLICATGSAVLEFSTSYILEKLFHAVWWDYSNQPFNIQGRICLPATCAFGAAGILIVRYVLPVSTYTKSSLPGLVFESLSLLFMAVLASDVVLTVSSLTSLLKKADAMENLFNENMEAYYRILGDRRQELTDYMREYEQKVQETFRSYAATLSSRQRYAVGSIKRFTRKNAGTLEYLRSSLAETRSHLEKKIQNTLPGNRHAESTQQDSDSSFFKE